MKAAFAHYQRTPNALARPSKRSKSCPQVALSGPRGTSSLLLLQDVCDGVIELKVIHQTVTTTYGIRDTTRFIQYVLPCLRPYDTSSTLCEVTILDFSEDVSLIIECLCRWPRPKSFCLGSLAVLY
jgi:hypothetical protein